MALLAAIATGNASAAATWGVVNATSLLNTQVTSANATTAFVIPTGGGLTQPGAITISHIMVKVAGRVGTTGLFRVALYSATGTTGTADAAITTNNTTLTDTRAAWATDEFVGAIVTCNGKTMTVTGNTATVLTGSAWSGGSNPGNGFAWSINVVQGTGHVINVSDLPAMDVVSGNGDWVSFKLLSPVLLLAATNYGVMALTTTGTMVTLWQTATTNLNRALVTTTTQAPTAGDDMIICRQWTAPVTSNAFTVTWDITVATDFGAAPAAATSLIQPGVSIGDGGTLTWATTATTNYIMRMSNSINISAGGILNMGTVATPCPRDSTMVLEFDCPGVGDYGLIVRNLGTFIAQGLSRTLGNLTWQCKLNTDEAIASTNLGVDTDTGWLDNDEIAVASTTRTYTDCEAGTLNGNAGVSTLTVDGFLGAGGGLAVAHSGTSPTQAEVVLLTRNVNVRSTSTTNLAYVDCKSGSTIDIDWTRFRYLGTHATNKFGIMLGTATAGSHSIRYSSLCDFGADGIQTNNVVSGLDRTTIQYNVFWRINTSVAATAGGAVYMASTWVTGATESVFDGNVIMLTLGSKAGFYLSATCGVAISNNTVAGSAGPAFAFMGTTYTTLTTVFNGNISHSCASVGYSFQLTSTRVVISNFTAWRHNSGILGGSVQSTAKTLFDTGTVFGMNNSVINMGSYCKWRNVLFTGDTTFGFATGFTPITNATCTKVEFESCTFGSTSGIFAVFTSRDILPNITAHYEVVFVNCTFTAATLISTPHSLIGLGSSITSLRHNGVAGDNRVWKFGGGPTISLSTDTVIYSTASPSLRMTPGYSTVKLESNDFAAAVNSGATLTPSVKVRESVVGDGTAYNGGRVRLWVRANHAVGILADTLLATATAGSTGAWETISGTTITTTDDGVLTFFVDCDGTTGWVNIDDFSCLSENANGMKHWEGYLAGPHAFGLPAGGGGSVIVIED